MPPDTGGYQRQLVLLLPYLRPKFSRILWIGGLRDELDRSQWKIAGVDRAIRISLRSLHPKLSKLSTPVVVALALMASLGFRAMRKDVRVLLLSPVMRGAPLLVRALRALGYPVVARYPTFGDLTDVRGAAVGQTQGVTAIVPSPSQVREQSRFPVIHVPNAVVHAEQAATDGAYRRFLYVGRLVRRKRADVLVAAWSSVAELLPDWELVLVGDGGFDDDSIERDLKESLIRGELPRVRMTGRLADPAAELEAAQVFVFPSIREGQPNSVLEALAAGLPVIADPGRVAEWFSPVPPHLDWTGTEADLGQAMLRAAERGDLKHLGALGQSFVREHHAPARTAAAFAEALGAV